MPGPPNQPSGTHDEQIDEDEWGTDMYWPGTIAAGGAAGFEAALALRVTKQETEPVASPPVTSRPVGQALPGTQVPVAPAARDLPCMEDPDLSKGVHFSLFNNTWGTNYIQWFGEDVKFRFEVKT